jgi:hypothetical protein
VENKFTCMKLCSHHNGCVELKSSNEINLQNLKTTMEIFQCEDEKFWKNFELFEGIGVNQSCHNEKFSINPRLFQNFLNSKVICGKFFLSNIPIVFSFFFELTSNFFKNLVKKLMHA